MKKFVLTALCALVSVSAFAQGTIQLSNIGKGIVSIDGAAAGPGSATVQYADANNNLVQLTELLTPSLILSLFLLVELELLLLLQLHCLEISLD